MSEQLTQRIAFPDGEVRYIMPACYTDCPHERYCNNCPHFQKAIKKLGRYEAREIINKIF